MKILILGANGFIGNHLSEAILKHTPWHIFAMDLMKNNLHACLEHKNFNFYQGDLLIDTDWVTEQIKKVDVVLPLVAIANPALYVQDPLRVFELDFEANLKIVRLCVQFQKRIIFPSTSEVYGMCPDAEFDEESSVLVTGPIHRERWIYSASKQLMDRIIFAYGKRENLSYTLFRPFNWYGPKLDNPFNSKPGASRVLTQFIGNILQGENILLVNGGAQQRCFMYIDDGIRALMTMIENKNNVASQQIFNLGNPAGNISIRELAQQLMNHILEYPKYAEQAKKVKLMDVNPEKYYGEGYQDILLRVPSILRAKKKLNWQPHINLTEGLKKTLDFYLK